MEIQNQYKKLLEAVQSHPFFQGVEVGTALSLIKHCHYKEYENKELLLYKDKPREGLILILEGIAEVYVQNETNGQDEVLEVVQKDEWVGFSSLADFLGVPRPTKDQVMVEVRAIQQVKALHIPFQVIEKRWEEPRVREYVFTQVAVRLRDVYRSLAEQIQLASDLGENEAFMTRVLDVMSDRVVAVSPNTSIRHAAKNMHDEKTSSVLVIENESLKGIITERDMVARVIAEGIDTSEPVETIMTKEPITISRTAYFDEAISLILLKGIKHLPVVEGGKVVGMTTLSDLLRKKNEGVMKTIKQIEESDENHLPHVKKAIYAVLDTLLRERVPIYKTLDIVTNLYDRLVVRIVNLSIEKLPKPPGPFALYQMGSSGRGEQFMLTDQDHFLVYQSEDDTYFELLGKKITRLMELAGYERCKGLMMCSEKQWRGNLLTWEDRLRTWSLQATPTNLLRAQNFFSFRFVSGSPELHEHFEKMVVDHIDSSKIFLYRLAQLERENSIPIIDQPFRSLFNLEKKSIDMKKSVLFPYHHSLQILSLLNGIPSGTSLEKIELLQKKGVISEDLSQDVQEAVSQLLTLYVKQRWKQRESGEESSSVLHFTRLSTREKEELMLSLKTLRKLQGVMFSYFSI